MMKSFIFFAYLDPGSGSLIHQIIVGGLIAGVVTAKTYWVKLAAFFNKKKDGKKSPEKKSASS